jgi:hypothetical protein
VAERAALAVDVLDVLAELGEVAGGAFGFDAGLLLASRSPSRAVLMGLVT